MAAQPVPRLGRDPANGDDSVVTTTLAIAHPSVCPRPRGRFSFVAAPAALAGLLLELADGRERKPRRHSSRRTTWPLVRQTRSDLPGRSDARFRTKDSGTDLPAERQPRACICSAMNNRVGLRVSFTACDHERDALSGGGWRECSCLTNTCTALPLGRVWWFGRADASDRRGLAGVKPGRGAARPCES